MTAIKNIGGRPTQIGTFTNQLWQLDITNSENPNEEPSGNTFSFGPAGSTPLVGDWSGNGYTNIGVYVNGVFYLDTNGDRSFTSADTQISLGVAGIPVVGDWNKSGKTKVGIYDQNTGVWYLDINGTGVPTTCGSFAPGPGRIPVVGDWVGDGQTRIGWNYNGFWALDYSGDYTWNGEDVDKFAGFGGNTGETPIVGQWSGTGVQQIGFYYQGFWAQDYNGDFAWSGVPPNGQDRFGGFGGNSGEIPVIGDWDGNGKTKVGYYFTPPSPGVSSFVLDFNGNVAWDGTPTDRFFAWAQSSSTPIAGRWPSNYSSYSGPLKYSTPCILLPAAAVISGSCPSIEGTWNQTSSMGVQMATFNIFQNRNTIEDSSTMSVASGGGCTNGLYSVTGTAVGNNMFNLHLDLKSGTNCQSSRDQTVTLSNGCSTGTASGSVDGVPFSFNWQATQPRTGQFGSLRSYINPRVPINGGDIIGCGTKLDDGPAYGYSRCVTYTVRDTNNWPIFNSNLTYGEVVNVVKTTYDVKSKATPGQQSLPSNAQFLDALAIGLETPAIPPATKGVFQQTVTVYSGGSPVIIRNNCIVYTATDVTLNDVTAGSAQQKTCLPYVDF